MAGKFECGRNHKIYFDFSVFQILREINFGKCRSCKTVLSAVCLQFILYFSGAMQSFKVGKQKPVTVFMPTELTQLREMIDSGKKI